MFWLAMLFLFAMAAAHICLFHYLRDRVGPITATIVLFFGIISTANVYATLLVRHATEPLFSNDTKSEKCGGATITVPSNWKITCKEGKPELKFD